LIIGCGHGQEVEWLSHICAHVTGIDVNGLRVDIARDRIANIDNAEVFKVEDTMPFEDDNFDVIFMYNVCEHIIKIDYWFSEYNRVLKDGGVLINSFGPLFYSPFGAHLFDILKVPWGHLIFGFKATQEIRNQIKPNYSYAKNWSDRYLNRLTEKQYLKVVKNNGFKHQYYKHSTVKKLPVVGDIPIVKNLFINHIESIIEKISR
jgi:ubiquinone/menaquinone biosynthesis C-methylase UbiE